MRPSGDGSPKRILVLARERHVRRLVQVNLERAGHAVVIAASALEGWSLALLEAPDLIVCEEDQWELLEMLALDSRTRECTVLQLRPDRFPQLPWN